MGPIDPAAIAAREMELKKARWRKHPEAFAEEVFGVYLYPEQIALIRALAFDPLTAVVSGQKTGKGLSYGIVSWWDGFLFDGTRVILTSASAGQVDSILWREINTLWHRAVGTVRFNVKTGKWDLPKPSYRLTDNEPPKGPETGIHLANGSEIRGFTTDKKERIAGISGARLRFRVDEASGYPDEFFEALFGNCMGGDAFVSATSQGTQQTGWFYDAFHKSGSAWKCITLSCYDSPNVKAGRIVVPGLATIESIRNFAAIYGEDSSEFGVRVLGKFPRGSADSVINRGLVNDAVKRWEAVALVDGKYIGDKAFLDAGTGPLVLGVDVARFGDDETVVVPAREDRTGTPVAKNGFDTVDVAGLVASIARTLRRPKERVTIRVDVTGGLGAGPADALRGFRLPDGQVEFDVVDLNYSEGARDGKSYRLRDELWWSGRAVLMRGHLLPPNTKLQAELAEPTYRSTDMGKIKIEAKDEVKKRLKRSPDHADAWLQAVAWGSESTPVTRTPTYDSSNTFRFRTAF